VALDYYRIQTRKTLTKNKTIVEVYAALKVGKTKDLIIQGGDFHATWVPSLNLWSKDEQYVIDMIDNDIRAKYYRAVKEAQPGEVYYMRLMEDSDSGAIDRWHKYCQKQMRDTGVELDDHVTYLSQQTRREDYASKRLPYDLNDGPCEAYDELMSTLYSPEERAKLEWAIGAILAGDGKRLQKFIVLYGSAGTGKSTVLNIIQMLFEGYWTIFSSSELGSRAASFALEAFKDNPLVGIQHDGDLSRIEDNTRLNSLVSHETMEINEKFKSKYKKKFNTFLFMGTNKPVRITDAKSGLLRRLIDVKPSGRKLSHSRYDILMGRIPFELGAIAQHCLDEYTRMGFQYYDAYVPNEMMLATNDFYDFVEAEYDYLAHTEFVPLKEAWRRYKSYCEFANVPYPLSMRLMRTELGNYFDEFKKDFWEPTSHEHYSSVYVGFKKEKFGFEKSKQRPPAIDIWLRLTDGPSLFDEMAQMWPAQYPRPGGNGELTSTWEKCKTVLKDLDTHQVHHVRTPLNHIVIDFDMKEGGQKSLEKNLEAANAWPPTYAEVSKSGGGLHLHYIYTGDPLALQQIYQDGIEVKVFSGLQSLRRKLTLCNDIPVAVLSSGLPLKQKKGGDVVDWKKVADDEHLHNKIAWLLTKPEQFPYTSQAMSKIKQELDEAYEAGFTYNVTDMFKRIQSFAWHSSNNASKNVALLSKLHLMSKDNENRDFENFVDDISEESAREAAKTSRVVNPTDDDRIVFFDVEVYKNLFVICWKYIDDPVVHAMINPTSEEVEKFIQLKLVGFNNRKYDNHILLGRVYGYNNLQLYNLSQGIINGANKNDYFFSEGYNIGYADILDYSSKKQSLKKFEIELGVHHQEMNIPWDQEVPEDMVDKVVEYCKNDVIATEAVYKATIQDFVAREILADLSGLSVLNTTRQHTTRIIFGKNRHPQLVYTDLSKTFPGYEFVDGKNMYRGIDVGFGGYVYAEPGVYTHVALLDVASLHPNSIRAMNTFGEYTKNFTDILDARVAIKHHDYDTARTMLDGKLAKYLTDDESADKLAQALKIVINSVYGYTSATFDNPFRDPRNVNNIVALRGALFMVTLMMEVQKRGFRVAHIKTDSIKIPDATPEIIQYCMDFGKQYGYSFEHEATYEKMCLVNQAVYIAKYDRPGMCEQMYGYVPKDNAKADKKGQYWTATGTQFQIPYVFKKLFSGEEIEFKDLCETKSVTKGDIYLDFNEGLGEDEHDYQFVGRVGLFCPIKPGCGGGILYRHTPDDKYNAVTGTKGYRWLESEYVKFAHREDDIDLSYYNNLVDEAIDTLSKYCDVDWLRSDEEVGPLSIYMNMPMATEGEEELPWVG